MDNVLTYEKLLEAYNRINPIDFESKSEIPTFDKMYVNKITMSAIKRKFPKQKEDHDGSLIQHRHHYYGIIVIEDERVPDQNAVIENNGILLGIINIWDGCGWVGEHYNMELIGDRSMFISDESYNYMMNTYLYVFREIKKEGFDNLIK